MEPSPLYVPLPLRLHQVLVSPARRTIKFLVLGDNAARLNEIVAAEETFGRLYTHP